MNVATLTRSPRSRWVVLHPAGSKSEATAYPPGRVGKRLAHELAAHTGGRVRRMTSGQWAGLCDAIGAGRATP